ncbi:MAG: transcriptional repressor NrdR [Candidatus Stahlbacteria bacterium]|nr:transcriptional repressor NrdR [Candidatus Stahlbacteria bacterium]
MKCPFCGSIEDKVTDSRDAKEGTAIRRRRECLKCGQRFTTYEYIEKVSLMVIKRDGRREAFERQKLLTGIRIASRKRPISIDQIERIVDEVEATISEMGVREVSSLKIGEAVMARLKDLDGIAYIRFASVYRSFKDMGELIQEAEHLLETKE